MLVTNKPSAAPNISITFITIGVVMAIPAAVWDMLFDPQRVGKFFCVSFFFVGLAFVIIGLSVGYIGRSARKAEMLPPEATGMVGRQDPAGAGRVVTPTAAPASSPVVGTPTSNVVQTG